MRQQPDSFAPFVRRHIGPGPDEQQTMLRRIGYHSLEELLEAAIPDSIRLRDGLNLPPAVSEEEATRQLAAIADANQPMRQMIGMGYYGTHTPAVIRRNVFESPAWYTAYTPYQPEISQGRLEALINFQTMVADLTGLPVAGASLLDEATAAAEAMTLTRRAGKSRSNVFVVDADVFPQTLSVLKTRAEPLGIELVVTPCDSPDDLPAEFFGVLLQNPGASGRLRDHTDVIAAAHDRGALAAVACDLLSLALLASPGTMGADVAVGSAQRFGVPLGFGGPHAGFMSVRKGLERSMPGRLVGVSKDAVGRPAYRLALQTREQHIRRERATSNICTAQVLLAVMASCYAVYHGPEGIRGIAEHAHGQAARLAEALRAASIGIAHDSFFDTVVAVVPGRAEEVVADAATRGVNLRSVDEDHVGVACDETTTDADLTQVLLAFGVDAALPAEGDTPRLATARTDDYLTHEVFSAHRSETSMLRYLRRLADVDYALDRGMIPLGSCTMKLNATSQMEPVSWPEFADIHPYAPADQSRGYARMITDLESWLAEVTGYDAVSLQPNAGSQGEFAGLLAIRAWHVDRGDTHRDVCLIPSSAHGTNAASAVMAGMRVVVV
ncbi:aminomethyl-transferring glycine dehydrogenase subunit GcvPA, partial [Stackebrandtia soli]|uniref:aminomethyl-transferring glycine dehydrogenase subunit GcvPA n=1 Tax=Stackebrandtia soli TaxID=1892856 RepID=UPI0039EACDFD